MKTDAVFVSISRARTIDLKALVQKLKENPLFFACLDVDVEERIIEEVKELRNIIVTPHIAGGTVETRKRMFLELATKLAALN